MRPGHSSLGALGAAALLLAGLGCGAPSRDSEPPGTAVGRVVLHGQAPAARAFRDAAQVAVPTLVFIQVEALPPAIRDLGGQLVPPWRFQEPPETPQVGSGSGFVLTPEGHILTNNHVVAEAVSVTVVLADNRRFEAAVVGRDPDTDIAVLKVDGDSLRPAVLGDSDSLGVGDWVLALGYPLGLSLTVTAGIVSGTGRSIGIAGRNAEAAAPIEHFIQTDAAINPGNSGGPLVDLAGRVIGVNSAIASPTGYYSGYGFAVPINLARRVAEDLMQFGEVRRPRLGLRLADVTPADAVVYDLPAVEGVEIVGVDPEGPAGRAGVRLGDVVVALDSQPVRMVGDLQALAAQRRPGEELRLAMIRYGQPVSVTVPLGRFPSPAVRDRPAPRHAGPVALGFAVAQTSQGLVVNAVDRYSPAARAGVRPGQRLLALNRQAVRAAADLEAVLRELRSGVLSLRVADPDLGETIINFALEPSHRGR